MFIDDLVIGYEELSIIYKTNRVWLLRNNFIPIDKTTSRHVAFRW